MNWIDEIKWDKDGLVPAIAQDKDNGQILMMAWMNKEALQLTVEKNQAIYFSRSRQKLWFKGEESGNTQFLHSLQVDCDADVILLKVKQVGGIACHTGRNHCFYRTLVNKNADSQDYEWEITEKVLKSPDEMYGKSK
jgi:phosphoribosyl-AMP cyclohydrolase